MFRKRLRVLLQLGNHVKSWLIYQFCEKGVISVSAEAQLDNIQEQHSVDQDDEPTVKLSKDVKGKNINPSKKTDAPTKTQPCKLFEQMLQSTGTIQEMNESKEVSNGNNSLVNSKDKFTHEERGYMSETQNPEKQSETPLKKAKQDIHERPTTRKSIGEKGHQNSHNLEQNLEQDDSDELPVGTFEEVLHKIRSKNNESVPVILFQPNTNEMRKERNLLPPISSDKKYTLVLDLDETLIHFEEKEDGTSQFLIRPYAQYFLKQVAKYYEVVVFTAALQDYADYILDRMDTTRTVKYRLYRQHTDFSNNVYQKDLSKLGRELSRTIIVDNNAENFQLQPDNGVYIQSWYNDPQDQGLAKLAPLLIDIVKKRYDDVRVALKQFRDKAAVMYQAKQGSSIDLKMSLDPQNGKLLS